MEKMKQKPAPMRDERTIRLAHAEVMRDIYITAALCGRIPAKDYEERINRHYEEKRKLEAELKQFN
jgi:hypothetical protein